MNFSKLKILIIFIAIGMSPAYSLNPLQTKSQREPIAVDFLYEACSSIGETSRGRVPYFDCESYVYGVLDAYLAVSEIIPKQQRACFPRAIEPWRVLEDVRELLENGNGENIAGQAIIKALVIKYPCK